MNHLKEITKLKNRYFILRHGESKVNIAKIILSDPTNGVPDYGLTDKGKKQVRNSVSKNNILDGDTIIYSSDFKRAKETAEITKEILKTEEIHLTKLLHERFFGNFEKTTNKNYDVVWAHDAKDPNHQFENVESVNNVLDRTTKLILNLEKKYENKKILLVAHGDSLQILQTGFEMVCPSTHRGLTHLALAEIREIYI